MNRIIVPYSGGANSTDAIRSLANRRDAEIIALHLHLGIDDPTQQIFDQALAAGAARCHVLDVGEAFVGDFLLPALDRGAFDPDRDDLLKVAIPLIARKLVDVARMEHTSAIAAPQGIAEAIASIDPAIEVIAVETGAGSALVERRADPNRLRRPAIVAIDFENRIPVALNAIPMSLVEVIDCLSVIGRAHGLEGRSPALSMLRTAYQKLGEGTPARTVSLELFDGALAIVQREYSAT